MAFTFFQAKSPGSGDLSILKMDSIKTDVSITDLHKGQSGFLIFRHQRNSSFDIKIHMKAQYYFFLNYSYSDRWWVKFTSGVLFFPQAHNLSLTRRIISDKPQLRSMQEQTWPLQPHKCQGQENKGSLRDWQTREWADAIPRSTRQPVWDPGQKGGRQQKN